MDDREKFDYIPAIDLNDFNYELPRERIAAYPLEDRDKSRLMVADGRTGSISHHHFDEIPGLLPSSSLLVLNTTKVIEARLLMKKPETGGRVEILCVNPVSPSVDPVETMAAKGECIWHCMFGGHRVKPGLILESELHYDNIHFNAEILEKNYNEAKVKFTWQPENLTFSEILEEVGKTPLPPYIKREADELDKERYQTVYAHFDGSVAAPTAGLHFTEKIINSLKDKGIDSTEVILHVGPGTFKPIDGDDILNHNMHCENVYIPENSIRKILEHLKEYKTEAKIIATGTTSLRTLESLYWFGAKLALNIEPEECVLNVSQWEPYILEHNYSLPTLTEVLEKTLEWMEVKNIKKIYGSTQLLIIPGYKFRVVNGLITNFHIPKSTLILLVAAFLGNDLWRKVYNSALENDYRFLSYGDGSLLWR